MERRVILAVILSIALMYTYQAVFPSPPPVDEAATASPATATAPAPRQPAVAPAAMPEALLADSAEREIVVETADTEVVLTNRGGRVLHWRLKHYLDGNGEPVDLVPSNVPDDQPRPFELAVDDASVSSQLNAALYKATGDSGGRVDATAAPATLVFDYQDAGGLKVRKEFRFEPTSYLVTFAATVTTASGPLAPAIAWGPGLGDVGASTAGGSFFTGNYVQPPQAIYHLDNDVERIAAASVNERPVHEGEFRFAGIDDHYFIATAVEPGQTTIDYRALMLPGSGETQRQLIAPTFSLPREKTAEGVRFFVGPKHFETLRAVDGELVRSIHFGIFAWLAVPLLGALNWLHGYIGNYGWSIIALTLLINLVLFPLRHKSVVAMRKMQMIQPQVKAIQGRYADLKMTDPAKQKMNTEIMNLYREKGVNPASGCVPMLLQFPVLLAMYAMFSQAIELRGADFGLWIHDLSAHDPYYVTPVLMGATMFWQQKLTPSTADPAQQKVMMIMPLMMTGIFLQLASGLAVYYLVGNVWAIGQQYFTNWMIGPPAVPVPRPAADRRMKKAGAGKTPGAERES